MTVTWQALGVGYLLVGLSYTLVHGLRNRALLYRALRHVTAEVDSDYRETVSLGWLLLAVLFWTLLWPAGVVLDVRDWLRNE